MHNTALNTVLILGARGRFGLATARAFADAGWRVFGQTRPGAQEPQTTSIEWLGIDLHDTPALVHAAQGATVVVHALNPAYTNKAWQTQVLPMTEAALAIARALGATLMVPGNVYNFGHAMPAVLREDTPQLARTVKGQVRIQMEALLQESGVRCTVIRAGDFFGSGHGTWFDTAMVKDIRKGVFTYPGIPDVSRAWAYLPDLGRAFVAVAQRRAALKPLEVFHFAGHRITGQRWLDVLTPVARAQGWVQPGAVLKLGTLPWAIIRIGALFVPTWAALLEMRYLWQTPHVLANDKLTALIGPEPHTPLGLAAQTALADLGFGTALPRRQFIRILGGGAVSSIAAATAATTAVTTAAIGLSACSQGMPSEAIEAWRGPDAAVINHADVRHWLLSYAILAPHSHNLQSWVADLGTPNQINLYCDLKRLLPQTDPLSRQIMMSHGTFLELLDMAARERGLRAETTLFPQGAFGPTALDARPVATVRLVPDATVQKDPLFAQVLQRHTNRSNYDITRSVPGIAWAAMAAAANPAGLAPIRVGFAGLDNAAALVEHRRVAREAWRIELTVPRTIMESFDVLRVGASEIATHRDGLSLTSPMVVAMERLGLFDRTRAPKPDDYATTSQITEFDAKLASTPGFLWMVTPGNDRATQVNAGRAYARVQLAATAQGLAMQPLSQALQEYAEQKQPYADIHALTGATAPGATVQMWARVGYAPAVEPAPRRRLKDFIRA